MTSPQCKRFDTCNAPLCPLDEQSLKHSIWYPDEEICRAKLFSALPWIKAQRKIAKRASRMDRYFTLQMLKRNCIIKKGIEGLDPDLDEALQLKRWLKAHPVKKEPTDQERKVMRQRFKKIIRQ